jgi:hypothetical protein
MKTVKETKLKTPKKSIFRKCTASISILGLVWSTSAIAIEKESTVDMIDKVFNSAMGQIQQSMQQNQMMNQQAMMMSQLQPKTIPSKFFPHCKISQARGAFPKKACASGVQGPQALPGIEQMANLGNTYSDMYEQLMSPAQNSPFPVGLQCLENAKKGMVKSLQDRMNSLQGLQDKIAKEAQFFKEQNRKLLVDMEKSHKELFGGASGDLDAKTKDFSKYFDKNCQNIIGSDNLAKAAGAGLNGIRVGLMSTNTDAANFSLERGQIESDINSQIQKVKAQIKEQGIQSWREDVAKGEGSINGQDLARMGVNKPAVSIVMSEISRFDSKVGTIQKELKKIDPNYEIPPMDKNFGTDFAEFTKGADDYFKKQYINECVTMADKGVAISPEQILRSLKSGVQGGGGVALKNYKAALQNILNSDAFIEDKMAQIQKLDQKYQGSNITISYKNSASDTVNSSTYDLYKATVNTCAQNFTKSDTFSTTSSKGVSQQKKITRAKEYLNDLKELESTFASQIGNKIYDSVMNCSGRSEKSATCSTSDVFNQDSDAFCMKHATSCSSKVQQCYKKADSLVQAKKTQIKNFQAKYNKNVAALVAREEAYLKQVKTQVLADAEYLSKYFPGANYQVPEGLFIKMPEQEESEFGVELAGGGSLDFMKDLPEQIGKLKETLAKQSGEIEGQINEYIGAQKQAMSDQKQKWDSLADECYAAAQSFRAQVAEGNAKMQQAQQEQMGKVGEFCQRFGQLGNSNPAAGCGEGSNSASALYEDMAGVSSYLSSDTEMAVTDYNNHCAQVQSEAENGTEDESNLKSSSIAKICRKADGESDDARKALIDEALSNMPESLSKYKSNIKSYLKGDDDLNKKVKDDEKFADLLASYKPITSGSDKEYPSKEKLLEGLGQGSSKGKENISTKLTAAQNELNSTKSSLETLKANARGNEKCIGAVENALQSLSQDQNKLNKGKESFESEDYDSAKTSLSTASYGNSGLAGKISHLSQDSKCNGIAGVTDVIAPSTSFASGLFHKDKVGSGESNKLDIEEVKEKMVEQTNGDFCAAYKNNVAYESAKSCSSKSDSDSDCFSNEYDKRYNKETKKFKSVDRAIASLNNESADGQWQRIGQRTVNTQCQAANESERGIESYFQQMQQLGGADFSDQIGFGQ